MDRRDQLPALGEGLLGRLIASIPGGDRLGPLKRVAVAAALAAVCLLVAIVTGPFGFVALGAAAGTLVIARVPAARAGFAPLADLGLAALPLLLPLLVFAAAGVVGSSGIVQVAVGLGGSLAAWFAVIRPEFRDKRAVLEQLPNWGAIVRGTLRLGLPVALALVFLAGSVVDLLGSSDGAATACFVLAAGVLAAAGLLRLVSFGTTLMRLLTAIALGLLAAQLAAETGLFEDGPGIDAATLAVIAGAVFGATIAVEIAIALLVRDAEQLSGLPRDELPFGFRAAVALERPVAPRWLTDFAGVGGLLAALLSALLLMIAVFAALDAGGSKEGRDRVADATGAAVPPDVMRDDRRLAAAFSPVLAFTADQRWTPIAVDDYLRGARIIDWEERRTTVQTPADLDTLCPGLLKRPCYRMRPRCANAEDRAACAEALPDDKAVYVRVARRVDWRACTRTKPCADGSPDPFADARGKHASATEVLLQYWYFYPYNDWVAPVVVGDLRQAHLADWEAVTIGLSETEPLWVAFSAHCGGSVADWDQVDVTEADPAHRRPLVAVANGSQAGYRIARETRVPNFAECSGIPKDLLRLLSYAANIRDRTDDARLWVPSADDLRIVDARTPPMSYPGRWAQSSRTSLQTLHRDNGLGPNEPGPAAPPLQALWQRPMQHIFSGGVWRNDAPR